MLPTFTDISLLSTTFLADRDGWGDGDGKGFGFLLFLLLLGTGVFFLVRAIRQRRNGPASQQDARRLLDERFARGDIDRAEYEHRKAVLNGEDIIPPAPATAPTPPPPAGGATAAATMAAPASVADSDPAQPSTDAPGGEGADDGDSPGDADEAR